MDVTRPLYASASTFPFNFYFPGRLQRNAANIVYVAEQIDSRIITKKDIEAQVTHILDVIMLKVKWSHAILEMVQLYTRVTSIRVVPSTIIGSPDSSKVLPSQSIRVWRKLFKFSTSMKILGQFRPNLVYLTLRARAFKVL